MDGKLARQHMAYIQMIILHGCRKTGGGDARQASHTPKKVKNFFNKCLSSIVNKMPLVTSSIKLAK
jgi:hypothetical protein